MIIKKESEVYYRVLLPVCYSQCLRWNQATWYLISFVFIARISLLCVSLKLWTSVQGNFQLFDDNNEKNISFQSIILLIIHDNQISSIELSYLVLDFPYLMLEFHSCACNKSYGLVSEVISICLMIIIRKICV